MHKHLSAACSSMVIPKYPLYSAQIPCHTLCYLKKKKNPKSIPSVFKKMKKVSPLSFFGQTQRKMSPLPVNNKNIYIYI